MSIADKLTYLQTTKQLLKTEINKINNVLDDNSTFRSYPQELFNGYLDILNNGTDTLWSNLEKVSASGEEATLENVETAPIKMVLNGNTSQDTTTGKNLFTTDYLTSNSFTTYTKLTDNSFSFTATGTWKKASYKVPCKPNTNYYFNFSSTSSMYIQIRGVQTGTQIVAVYQAYLTTFNSGENTELQINIDIGQNSIASGTISDIQLEEGTTATSFEKYTGGQPSPSPDYPQQVKVVKGENVVSVQGKNLLNVPSTFSVTTSANITASLNAGTYTISLEDYETNVEVGSSFLFQFLKDNTLVTDAYLTMSYKKTTKAIPSEVDKIRIYASSSYNNSNGKTTTFKNLMIEQNSTATPYVPYSKTDYPINLGDIELCKINTYKDFLFKAINGNEYYDTLTDEQKNVLNYGSWYKHKEIQKYVITGQEKWIKNANHFFKAEGLFFYSKFVTGYGLCNQYVYNPTQSGLYASSSNNQFFLQYDRSYCHLFIRNDNYNDVTSWVSYLQSISNSILIYYPLATPTEEEITNSTLIEQLEAISNAKSVKDKTYITQTNEELPFILDVEAIKEYEVN